MHVTIGEIANEIMKYSSRIEMRMKDDVPYLTAYLQTPSTFRCIMYIAQVADYTYSIWDTIDDPIGWKIYPSGSTLHPFILEKDMIKASIGIQTSEEDPGINKTEGINFNDFIKYLYEKLYEYKIIKFDPKKLSTKITEDMGFTSNKIKNYISKVFRENGYPDTSLANLIDLVNNKGKPIDLKILRPREMKCVVGKLQDIHIIANVFDCKITNISIEISEWRKSIYGTFR